MRILVLTPYFHPHPGGSQHYIEELYVALIKRDRSIQVDVVCYDTDHQARKETYRGMTIYRVPCREILPGQFAVPNYFELMKMLGQLKRRYRYQIVNAHTRFFESAWWAPLVAKYLGAKSILTDHCANHPQHPSKVISMLTAGMDHLFIPVVVRFYSKVITVSQATQQFLNHLGIESQTVIYGGANPSLFKSNQNDSVRRVPKLKQTFSKQDVIVSFVGRMIPAKGALIAFEAAKKLTQKYPQLHVIFAGNGPLLKELKAETQPRIHVLGQLSSREVAKLLDSTNILINPTQHHEGFPLTLVEAGMAGCAVITTDNGGISELIVDRQTGLFCKPSIKSVCDAVALLMKQPSLAKKISTNLQKISLSQFSWDQQADAFFEVISRI